MTTIQQAHLARSASNVKLGKYEDQHTGLEHGTVTVRVTPKGVTDLAVVLGVLPEAAADYLDGAHHAAA